MIAEMVALLESRADSLEHCRRHEDAYEARRCANAVRRAA